MAKKHNHGKCGPTPLVTPKREVETKKQRVNSDYANRRFRDENGRYMAEEPPDGEALDFGGTGWRRGDVDLLVARGSLRLGVLGGDYE